MYTGESVTKVVRFIYDHHLFLKYVVRHPGCRALQTYLNFKINDLFIIVAEPHTENFHFDFRKVSQRRKNRKSSNSSYKM